MKVFLGIILPIICCICCAGLGFLGAVFLGKKLFIPDVMKHAQGVIRLVYDEDDPDHPAMGLMLENLDYILNNEFIVLKIEKKGFPDQSRKNQPL